MSFTKEFIKKKKVKMARMKTILKVTEGKENRIDIKKVLLNTHRHTDTQTARETRKERQREGKQQQEI